jgi:hypothetical protein
MICESHQIMCPFVKNIFGENVGKKQHLTVDFQVVQGLSQVPQGEAPAGSFHGSFSPPLDKGDFCGPYSAFLLITSQLQT